MKEVSQGNKEEEEINTRNVKKLSRAMYVCYTGTTLDSPVQPASTLRIIILIMNSVGAFTMHSLAVVSSYLFWRYLGMGQHLRIHFFVLLPPYFLPLPSCKLVNEKCVPLPVMLPCIPASTTKRNTPFGSFFSINKDKTQIKTKGRPRITDKTSSSLKGSWISSSAGNSNWSRWKIKKNACHLQHTWYCFGWETGEEKTF